MSLVLIGEPGPIVTDPSQGTPGAPSPTGGVLTVQGQSGIYPINVIAGITGPVNVTFPSSLGVTGDVGIIGPVGITGPVGVTGSVSVNNFPTSQGITGTVGVTGTVAIPTGSVIQGQGTAGVPAGGVVTIQGVPSGTPIPVTFGGGAQGVTGFVGVTGTVSITNFPTSQGITGTVNVGNFPTSQGITGTVSISGSVGITGPVNITGSVGITGAYDPVNNVLEVIQKVIATGTYSPSYFAGFGVSTGTVKASTGNLFSLKAINRGNVMRYLMLFNAATAPANGAVPFDQFVVPPGGTTSPAMLVIGEDYFSGNGVNFTTGIVFVFSSTNGTLTVINQAANQDMSATYF